MFRCLLLLLIGLICRRGETTLILRRLFIQRAAIFVLGRFTLQLSWRPLLPVEETPNVAAYPGDQETSSIKAEEPREDEPEEQIPFTQEESP